MTVRESIPSYGLYAAGLVGIQAVKPDTADKGVVEMTGTVQPVVADVSAAPAPPTLAETTLAQAPWLEESWAADWVQSGLLYVKDGHFFLGGIALTDIITTVGTVVTLLVVIAKFRLDIRADRNRRCADCKEKIDQ